MVPWPFRFGFFSHSTESRKRRSSASKNRRRPRRAICESLETRSMLAADLDDSIGESFAISSVLSAVTRSGSLDVVADESSDVDMIRFTAASGQKLSFDLDRPSTSTLNSYLRLFSYQAGNNTATELAVNDNAAAPGETLGNDSYLEYTFSTAGTYYLGISASGNQSYSATAGTGDSSTATRGAYTMVITDIDPDDQIKEASAVTVAITPTTSSGSILYSTDVDLYQFNANPGQTLSFDVDHNSGLNSFVRLFSANGTQVASNDNGAAPGETLNTEAFLRYTFSTAGVYYVGISGAGNIKYSAATGLTDTASVTTGSYTWTLTCEDLDDAVLEAPLMPAVLSAQARTSSIEVPWDVDLVAFQAVAGQTFSFDLDRTGVSTLDSLLRIFDSSGNELASNDDAAAPGESSTGGDSYLTYSFQSSGTYYLGISAKENLEYITDGTADATAGSQGAYTVTLTFLDPDDQATEATQLASVTSPLTESGSIESPSDVDTYQFTAAAGQTIAFDIDRPQGSTLNSFLRVFNQSGSAVASNDNGIGPEETLGQESFIAYKFATAGTYYVSVSGAPNSSYNVLTGLGDVAGSTGDYSLNVQTLDPDDQLTEAVALGAILLPVSKASSIEVPKDVDLFKFTVGANQRLSFDIDHVAGSGLNSFVRLFDANGTEVASNDDGAGKNETSGTEAYLEYLFTSAGTYYLGISSQDNESYNATTGASDSDGSTSGSFTLQVAIVDPDDELTEATELGAIDGAVTETGRIDLVIDVDLYEFTAVAGQTVTFDVDLPSGSVLDSYLRIFSSTGQMLSSNDNAAAPGEVAGKASYVSYNFKTTGTFYLGVSFAGNRGYLPTTGLGDVASTSTLIGDYTVTMTLLDLDDTFAESYNLGSVTTYVRRSSVIDSAGDVDMMRFTATAGQKLGFDVDLEAGSSLNSYVRVFAADGTELAANAGGAALSESANALEAYTSYTFATGGTYYVAVSGEGNEDYDPQAGTGDGTGNTGAYSLTVLQVPDPNGFQITLSFSGLSESQKAIFQQAANIWGSIIVGDVPDVTYNGTLIDDVAISARGAAIDGVGRILGQAGPGQLRAGSYLPITGSMEFDTADLASLESSGQLLAVILHEMGHVLGIGTLWSYKGLLSGAGTSNPRYTGTNATAAYNRLYNNSETSIPVENSGGAGTRDSHWRESIFTNEIMTGYLNATNVLSEMTIASLADLGYLVDLDQAGNIY